MHWIKATTPDGREQYLNLANVFSMLSDGKSTMIFVGPLAVDSTGAMRYSTTATKETPEELLAMAPVVPGTASSKPDRPTSVVAMKRKKQRV